MSLRCSQLFSADIIEFHHDFAHADVRMLFTADIILKLDKLLLLAANKQLIMEPGVEPVRSISTKTEDHLLGVNDSPVHDSRIESAKDGSSEGGWLDIGKVLIPPNSCLFRLLRSATQKYHLSNIFLPGP